MSWSCSSPCSPELRKRKKNTGCFIASYIQGPWIINPPPTAGCVQSDFNVLLCLYTRHYPSLHCLMCVCSTEPRSCRQKQHDTFHPWRQKPYSSHQLHMAQGCFLDVFPSLQSDGKSLVPCSWVSVADPCH